MSRISPKARLLGIAATTVGLLAGALTATPAMAEPPSQWDVCPNGTVCIWADPSFQSHDGDPSPMYNYREFSRYIPNYGTWMFRNTNIGASNKATSIVNDAYTETAYMYANTSKRDRLFSIPKGHYNQWMVGGHNDNIESGYYYTYN